MYSVNQSATTYPRVALLSDLMGEVMNELSFVFGGLARSPEGTCPKKRNTVNSLGKEIQEILTVSLVCNIWKSVAFKAGAEA